MLLQKRGYDVGRVDGVLGLKSRVAIRDLQIKSGLPADGWPTAELPERARTGSRFRRRTPRPARVIVRKVKPAASRTLDGALRHIDHDLVAARHFERPPEQIAAFSLA